MRRTCISTRPSRASATTAPHVAEQLREASLAAFDSLVELCLERQVRPSSSSPATSTTGPSAAFGHSSGSATVSPGSRQPASRASSSTATTTRSRRAGRRSATPGRNASRSSAPERSGRCLSRSTGSPSRPCRASASPSAASPRTWPCVSPAAPGPGIQVGVLHCNVQGAASGYDDYSPCTLDELRSLGLDYWALGHVHTADDPRGPPRLRRAVGRLLRATSRPAAPSRASEDRRARRWSTSAAGASPSVEPVSCDVVRFDLVELDVAGIADLAELRGPARSRPPGTVWPRPRGARSCSAAQLVGQGDLHFDLRRPGSMHDLLVALREDFARADRSAGGTPSTTCRGRRSTSTRPGPGPTSPPTSSRSPTSSAAGSTEERAAAELAAELSEGLPGSASDQQQALERLLDVAEAARSASSSIEPSCSPSASSRATGAEAG